MRILAILLLSTITLAEYKIVTIDINRILNESKEAKAKRAEIDKKSAAATASLEKDRGSLMALEKKAKESKSEADVKAFREKQRSVSKFIQETENSIQSQVAAFNEQLTNKAMKEIEAYAKSEDIDLVLYKGEQPRGPVLFGEAGGDITDIIMSKLDK